MIIYDNVIINVGNMYDLCYGIFWVLVKGFYYMMLILIFYYGSEFFVEMVKDG